MFGRLPFWPESASTNAGNVDALYIFLVLVSGVIILVPAAAPPLGYLRDRR